MNRSWSILAEFDGGTVTDFSGGTTNLPHEILATNGKIHTQLSSLLTSEHK